MRDAFGGVFVIQILLVFILIYVGFIAISLNYSRAFRIKNYIIEYIEESELTYDRLNDDIVVADITNLTDKYGYANSAFCNNPDLDSNKSVCINGVVITKNTDHASNLYGVDHFYYTVSVPVSYNLGFLGALLSLTNGSVENSSIPSGVWHVSGETRVIVRS